MLTAGLLLKSISNSALKSIWALFSGIPNRLKSDCLTANSCADFIEFPAAKYEMGLRNTEKSYPPCPIISSPL